MHSAKTTFKQCVTCIDKLYCCFIMRICMQAVRVVHQVEITVSEQKGFSLMLLLILRSCYGIAAAFSTMGSSPSQSAAASLIITGCL